MQTLSVDLGERSYPIHIGNGLLRDKALLGSSIKGSKVVIVSNETVAPLYMDTVANSLERFAPVRVVLPDGEQYKNLDCLNRIFDSLLENRCDRDVTLVALGGGVIGDMTGFAAACYQRGVNFVQIPTTLLAQVDSSVGGKTGVNHPSGKNMIGAFYQPRAVFIDIDSLATLPDNELSAGLAEVIKYGLIIDPEFFSWLQKNMQALIGRDNQALAHAIRRSCEIKADVVARDEREGGIRALLNLGHTFGHAIEASQGYGQWLHGEAVAAGMVMAADLSQRLGWLTVKDVATVRDLINEARLPCNGPADMTIDDYFRYMSVDKKVKEGRMRFVLLKKIGEAVVTGEVPRDQIEATLKACTG